MHGAFRGRLIRFRGRVFRGSSGLRKVTEDDDLKEKRLDLYIMGLVDTQSKIASGVFSPFVGKGQVQDSEEEKIEVMEGPGTLTSEDVFRKVGKNGDKGLGDDGVVDIVETSGMQTEVLVLKENDCQILAATGMNNEASYVLEMQESGKRIGVEKLEGEGRVVEAAGFSGDGLVGVDTEDRKDGKGEPLAP